MSRPVVKRDSTVELDGVYIGSVVRFTSGWGAFSASGVGSGNRYRYRGEAVQAVITMHETGTHVGTASVWLADKH